MRIQDGLKRVCVLPIQFNCSEKLQNIFEIRLTKCQVIVQKSLSEKKYLEIKNSQTRVFSALGPETDEQMKLAKNKIRVNL